MDRAKSRWVARKKRAERVRASVVGTAERPRLCVRRSLKHMSAQIVDDFSQRTIVHVSSDSKEFAEKSAAGAEKKPLSKTDRSKIVGQMVAEKAKGKGVTKVVFDRKGFAYHGRVKALADAARSGGLQF